MLTGSPSYSEVTPTNISLTLLYPLPSMDLELDSKVMSRDKHDAPTIHLHSVIRILSLQPLRMNSQGGVLRKYHLSLQTISVLPLGLVPKPENGVQIGWRLIFDLSSPEGASVNDGIPKE